MFARSRAGTALLIATLVAVAGGSGPLSTTVGAATRPQTPKVDPPPLPVDPRTAQDSLDSLGISGYASRMSVEPGQSVSFRVTTKSPNFRATMVRVVHGDADPRGPGLKEQVIASDVNKDYPGRYQTLPLGSYVTVPDHDALRPDGSFTLAAWIAPTTVPGSKLNPIAYQRTPVGTGAVQGIVTKWSDKEKAGYGMVVDRDGGLGLRLTDHSGTAHEVSTGVKLKPWAPALRGVEPGGVVRPQHVTSSGWYFAAVSYDASTGKVTLYQDPLTGHPNDSAALVTRTIGARGLKNAKAPLLIAAYQGAGDRPAGFYNGKIDAPRVFDRALDERELRALGRGGSAGGAVAAFDFSRKMDTDRAVDTSRNHLDGRVVNLPVRAVTGHNWKADEQDWKRAPDQYGAMYFHDDDLGDAAWEPSFTWRVPDDARSGVYAAKLEAGGRVYHAPFVVRPKRGKPTSKVALLVPTFSYLAYGATGDFVSGMSQYSRHSDGSGIVYSSGLRPLTNQRPLATGAKGEGRPWQFEADTHITDWLESTGHKVDYITDHDLHREGAKLLDDYKVVITGSHPEYTSETMLDSLQGWLNNGGRLMYLGGNGFYWVTPLDRTGTYTELRRHDGTEAWQGAPGEHYHNTTGEYGGLWRFRGRPPQQLVGVGFTAQGFGSRMGTGLYARPLERSPQSHDPKAAWIFNGVKSTGPIGDFDSLQEPGGPMGEELDRADYALGSADNTIVLGSGTGFGDEYLFVKEENNTANLMEGGTINWLVRGDVALTQYPKGGAVFSASSISWAGCLFYNHYDNDISTITGNVLNTFATDKPLPGTG
ncbi:N,N-dimethylformamidase beta subunit family domain-containing protein [Actinomadura roseirufa]|uniref:N,N-dimethylformamidase beta subunit family domain-containing protein n=1 Tax=Actinomadura roseirufa TaxID=2094049 RepID=UPI00104133C4|nr:N,N-dimethylformamidase beta subunit family domain-containing protein [Actinomadura roseirufa]